MQKIKDVYNYDKNLKARNISILYYAVIDNILKEVSSVEKFKGYIRDCAYTI